MKSSLNPKEAGMFDLRNTARIDMYVMMPNLKELPRIGFPNTYWMPLYHYSSQLPEKNVQVNHRCCIVCCDDFLNCPNVASSSSQSTFDERMSFLLEEVITTLQQVPVSFIADQTCHCWRMKIREDLLALIPFSFVRLLDLFFDLVL